MDAGQTLEESFGVKSSNLGLDLVSVDFAAVKLAIMYPDYSARIT
jgi:hypothetical protein